MIKNGVWVVRWVALGLGKSRIPENGDDERVRGEPVGVKVRALDQGASYPYRIAVGAADPVGTSTGMSMPGPLGWNGAPVFARIHPAAVWNCAYVAVG